MFSVIPLPYRILAMVGLVLALFGSGLATGWHFADQAAEVERLAKEAKQAKALADARAVDAHNAREAAAIGRQQYLDEEKLVAALKAKVARHEQEEPPAAPEPGAQPEPTTCPNVPIPMVQSCPGGLSDARARWLRELATTPLGDEKPTAGAPLDLRNARPRPRATKGPAGL